MTTKILFKDGTSITIEGTEEHPIYYSGPGVPETVADIGNTATIGYEVTGRQKNPRQTLSESFPKLEGKNLRMDDVREISFTPTQMKK